MIKLFLVLFFSVFAIASGGSVGAIPDITFTWVGFAALGIFVIGYYFVAMEEKYHLDKAKPALFMGTFIFMLIALYYAMHDMDIRVIEVVLE